MCTPRVGFSGCGRFFQAVVFSEGELVLDSVDFSASSAPVLVFMEGSSAKSVVRNTVLGDSNCESGQGCIVGYGLHLPEQRITLP